MQINARVEKIMPKYEVALGAGSELSDFNGKRTGSLSFICESAGKVFPAHFYRARNWVASPRRRRLIVNPQIIPFSRV